MKFGPLLRRKHIIHWLSAKASHKRPESLFKPSSPCTLMKPHGKRDMKRDLLKLMDVKLIGMTVEHEGGGVHHAPGEISARKSWQQTMVSTSAYRPISSECRKRGQWSLQNAASPVQMNPHRKDRPVRNAISRVLDRHDAGVVLKTSFHKRIKSPESTPDNRKIGRTISFNLLPSDLFQDVLGMKYVGQKFLGRLLCNFQMSVTVASYFMTI